MNPGMRPARSSRDAGTLDGHPDISPRFRRTFPGRPDQVALAREFVAAALDGCSAAPDAILLTSELATNTVQHSATGRGGFLTVAVSHGSGRVRVTVTDDGSATRPAVAVADELATTGRGLLLVDCLARRWGHATDPARAGGGAVWFELACS
jgi:serine/threonine-protein kinase RsbW